MQNSLPSNFVPDKRLRLIVDSYRRLTGKALIGNVSADNVVLRHAVWNAPRAIVAHGTEDDPVFFYGNRLALQLFEMNFGEFARLPSRLSAEPLAQESREKALAKVTQQGFVDGYSGARIASSGRRFMISNTTIWNLTDEAGVFHGQAAEFADWEPL
jgi:hypothetical protein